jgi:hypothetical protein
MWQLFTGSPLKCGEFWGKKSQKILIEFTAQLLGCQVTNFRPKNTAETTSSFEEIFNLKATLKKTYKKKTIAIKKDFLAKVF